MTAPFERLRTMMMADYSNRTLLGTARKMWRSGGFLGLWRGNLVSVVKVVPQSAIQYAVGLTLAHLLQDIPSFWVLPMGSQDGHQRQ